ncbi:hypothetical protein [Streptomyces sp. NPDC051994]|uniref:hypothetical protein n=1 Tax=unclassified Streptomyces TaxID=2593676 RepID=UPI0034120BFF
MEFFGFLLAPSTPLFVHRFLLQPSLNGSDGCEVLGGHGQCCFGPQKADRGVVEVGPGAQTGVDVGLRGLVFT